VGNEVWEWGIRGGSGESGVGVGNQVWEWGINYKLLMTSSSAQNKNIPTHKLYSSRALSTSLFATQEAASPRFSILSSLNIVGSETKRINSL
jgi:hypothetical protein